MKWLKVLSVIPFASFMSILVVFFLLVFVVDEFMHLLVDCWEHNAWPWDVLDDRY